MGGVESSYCCGDMGLNDYIDDYSFLGAAKSLHLGIEEPSWEMVAFAECNGLTATPMLTEEVFNEVSIVSWTLTLLLKSKNAQKANDMLDA